VEKCRHIDQDTVLGNSQQNEYELALKMKRVGAEKWLGLSLASRVGKAAPEADSKTASWRQ
jgi:hypothetical protein